MANPAGKMLDSFASPTGTYRGVLINKKYSFGPVYPDVQNPDHANYRYYNIKVPNGDTAAIIKGEDRNGVNWFNTIYGDE